jgi:TPR repeat protein
MIEIKDLKIDRSSVIGRARRYMQKDSPSGRVLHKILRDFMKINDPEAIYLAALYPKKQGKYHEYHLSMLKKSADLGYPAAMRMLAEYYFSGDICGVIQKDISKSMLYFKLAAEIGDPAAMKSYGFYLSKGLYGLKKDDRLGLYYINNAKELGSELYAIDQDKGL